MAEMNHDAKRGYTVTLTDREYDALKTRVIVLEAALRKILFECDTIEAAAREARLALPTPGPESATTARRVQQQQLAGRRTGKSEA